LCFFFILTQIPIDKNPFLWYSNKAVIKRNFIRKDIGVVTFAKLTRKAAELITLQLAKALVFFDYLANASFFLNFG